MRDTAFSHGLYPLLVGVEMPEAVPRAPTLSGARPISNHLLLRAAFHTRPRHSVINNVALSNLQSLLMVPRRSRGKGFQWPAWLGVNLRGFRFPRAVCGCLGWGAGPTVAIGGCSPSHARCE